MEILEIPTYMFFIISFIIVFALSVAKKYIEKKYNVEMKKLDYQFTDLTNSQIVGTKWSIGEVERLLSASIKAVAYASFKLKDDRLSESDINMNDFDVAKELQEELNKPPLVQTQRERLIKELDEQFNNDTDNV